MVSVIKNNIKCPRSRQQQQQQSIAQAYRRHLPAVEFHFFRLSHIFCLDGQSTIYTWMRIYVRAYCYNGLAFRFYLHYYVAYFINRLHSILSHTHTHNDRERRIERDREISNSLGMLTLDYHANLIITTTANFPFRFLW